MRDEKLDPLATVDVKLIKKKFELNLAGFQTLAGKVFDEGIIKNRRRALPYPCWKDQILEIISSFGVSSKRILEQNMGAWKKVLRHALILHTGCYGPLSK